MCFLEFLDELVTMRADPDLFNSISVSAGDGQPLNDDQICVTETRFRHQKCPEFSRGLRPRTPIHPHLAPPATPSRTYVLAGFWARHTPEGCVHDLFRWRGHVGGGLGVRDAFDECEHVK